MDSRIQKLAKVALYHPGSATRAEKRWLMETIDQRKALVVEKSEVLDPEDMDVDLRIVFVAGIGEGEKSVTITMSTEDREFFVKFTVGEEYNMGFLKDTKAAVATKMQ